jgi:hypothetical protein
MRISNKIVKIAIKQNLHKIINKNNPAFHLFAIKSKNNANLGMFKNLFNQ